MTIQQSPAPPPYTAIDTINETTTMPVGSSPQNIPVIEQYWYRKGIFGLRSRAALRALQFIFAVIAAGLYGIDLAHATRHTASAPSEWVYAEMIVCFSVVTCVFHAFVTVKRVTWCLWDGVLFIFWLAQVGVFGSIYYASPLNAEYEGFTQCVPRMKAAVWIDLVNMLLWFSTFVLGVAWCIRARKITRRTDKMGGVQDVERLGEQEIGHEVLQQKCLGGKGDETGYEKLDEKPEEKLEEKLEDTGHFQQENEK